MDFYLFMFIDSSTLAWGSGGFGLFVEFEKVESNPARERERERE